jgi:hypothetical protein
MIEEIIKHLIDCDWFIHGVKSSEENLPSSDIREIAEYLDAHIRRSDEDEDSL